MMRKLGVSAVFGMTPAVPFEAQMPLIKRAGFDVCFAPYKKDEPLRLWADLSEKLDLPIETLHAPFDHMNTLWVDAPEGEDYLNFQLTRIDGCSEIGVEKCVMHVTIANTAPPVSDVGLRRFRKMCDYAQEKGVRLCFENLEIPGHLAAVLADNPEYHGFCWDCGHNYCYTPLVDMMALYGRRLLCLHVHDNFGVRVPGRIHYVDDLHLLPMDGGLDWNAFAERIRSAGFDGPLTLEISKRGLPGRVEYNEKSLRAYLEEAFRRATALRALVDG